MTADGSTDVGPRVRVTTEGEATPIGPDQWQMSWLLTNGSDEPLAITSAWLPHARFRSEPIDYSPPLVLPPGETLPFQFPASLDWAGGPVVENGFILLRTRWREEPWRIFVRVRVTLNEQGQPVPSTEDIRTQPIAFEG